MKYEIEIPDGDVPKGFKPVWAKKCTDLKIEHERTNFQGDVVSIEASGFTVRFEPIEVWRPPTVNDFRQVCRGKTKDGFTRLGTLLGVQVNNDERCMPVWIMGVTVGASGSSYETVHSTDIEVLDRPKKEDIEVSYHDKTERVKSMASSKS